MLSLKTFLALTAWIQLFSSMYLFVTFQTAFHRKPFVTHCTQIRSSLVIISDIITISFCLITRRTFTCIICTTWRYKTLTVTIAIVHNTLSLLTSALFLTTTSLHVLYAPPTPICCQFLVSTQPLLPVVSALLPPQYGTHSLLALIIIIIIVVVVDLYSTITS